MFLNLRKKLRLNTKYLNKRVGLGYTSSNLAINTQKRSRKFFFKLFRTQNLITKCLVTLFLTKMITHFNKSAEVKFSSIQPFQPSKLFFNSKTLELTTSKTIKISKFYNNYLFNKYFHESSMTRKKRITSFMILGNVYDVLNTRHYLVNNQDSSYKISETIMSTESTDFQIKMKNLRRLHETLTPLS